MLLRGPRVKSPGGAFHKLISHGSRPGPGAPETGPEAKAFMRTPCCVYGPWEAGVKDRGREAGGGRPQEGVSGALRSCFTCRRAGLCPGRARRRLNLPALSSLISNLSMLPQGAPPVLGHAIFLASLESACQRADGAAGTVHRLPAGVTRPRLSHCWGTPVRRRQGRQPRGAHEGTLISDQCFSNHLL